MRFYTDIAGWARGAGLLRLAFLRLDGRAIAFAFGLQDGTAFYLLKACLGLSFQPATPRICFASPLLPAFLQQVQITNLDLDGHALDLDLHYHPQDVATRITRRIGNVEMVIVK